MKLSKELYNAGILGRQNTGPSEWVLEDRAEVPRTFDPTFGATYRREQSIKVSPRGLRVLANVLRLH